MNNNIKLEKLYPEKMSKIKVSFSVGNSRINNAFDIIVIRFSGEYDSDSDAHYMYAKGQFALMAYQPMGIILDFRDLEYHWGDKMDLVFDIGMGKHEDDDFSTALLISEKCKKAIGTLVHDDPKSEEPATTKEWIFETLEESWKYIEQEIMK